MEIVFDDYPAAVEAIVLKALSELGKRDTAEILCDINSSGYREEVLEVFGKILRR